jgi:hypothetical protein
VDGVARASDSTLVLPDDRIAVYLRFHPMALGVVTEAIVDLPGLTRIVAGNERAARPRQRPAKARPQR